MIFIGCLVISMAVEGIAENLAEKANEVYYRDEINNQHADVRKRIAWCDSLIRLTPKSEHASLYLKKGRLQYETGLFRQAAESLGQGLEVCDKDALSLRCDLLYNAALAQFSSQKLHRSVMLNVELLDLIKPDSLKYYDVKGHILLANIHKSMNAAGGLEYQKELLDAALKKYGQLDTTLIPRSLRRELLANIHNGLSTIDLGRGNHEAALENIKKAMALTDDSMRIVSLKTNLGHIYETLGNYDKAEQLYREMIDLNRNHINTWVTVFALSTMWYNQGRYDEVMALLDVHEDKQWIISGSIWEVFLNNLKAEIYWHQGKSQQAFTMKGRALVLRDSIASSIQDDYYGLLRKELEHRSDVDSRDALKMRTMRLNHLVTGLGISGGLILLLLIWVVFKNAGYRKKISGLEEKMERDRIGNEENLKSKEEALEKSNRELASKILQLTQIKERLDHMGKNKNSDDVSNENVTEEIERLKKELKINQNTWEPFFRQFEKIHPSFFTNLAILSDSLTPAEKRMSAFILMNLTTKEIAEITHRSPRTVDCVKYNLRQKLGITGSSEVFMQTVATSGREDLESLRNQNPKGKVEKG